MSDHQERTDRLSPSPEGEQEAATAQAPPEAPSWFDGTDFTDFSIATVKPDIGELALGDLGADELVKRVLPEPEARLEVLQHLAKGGMGSVEIVVDTALRRRIAMKTIDPRLREDRRIVAWFLREAQITGQLDHPNIVPVHDVGVDALGRLYFTMKLVGGETYAKRVRRLPQGPMSSSDLFDVLEIVIKVCDAMAFAHSRGVIHCDIKPQNVMVGSFGEVYVMDWGLARYSHGAGEHQHVAGSEQVTSALDELDDCEVTGTPAYMAPEQARYGSLDERADIFAVGALLYFACSRRAPYKSGSVPASLGMARRHELKPIDKLAGEGAVPRDLQRIVYKAMAKDPADRYQSVAEMRGALQRFMRGGTEFERRRVSAGDHVVREGEVGDDAYIIVTGKLEVYREVDNERRVLRTMGPGEVFGETAILASAPRSASVVAIEESFILVVSREVFEQELGGMKPWMGAFVRTLARRFRDREDQILDG